MPKPITHINPQIQPKPELEKRTRRVFSTEYKLSILQQADACKHGELGTLLRRENSIPISWRNGVGTCQHTLPWSQNYPLLWNHKLKARFCLMSSQTYGPFETPNNQALYLNSPLLGLCKLH
ncbi:MAG: hypothetical protein IBX55_18520 [Methyloprofundus sp.]|nr:hypothetical protein [Methyloprofundus sp.]